MPPTPLVNGIRLAVELSFSLGKSGESQGILSVLENENPKNYLGKLKMTN